MLQSSVKLFLLSLTGTAIILSCSSSKKATATASRDAVKGTWTLSNITYDGSVPLKLTLLDEGAEACLIGSTWVLPNNGYGSYTIATGKTGCTSGERKIVWSYRLENDKTVFQYKRLVDDVKAKNIEEGYRLNILSATETNMSLQSEVNFDGRPFFINYTFSKK
jgi:hypothetical protein